MRYLDITDMVVDKCGLCKKVFLLSELFMHVNSDILYVCNDCLEEHGISEDERLGITT